MQTTDIIKQDDEVETETERLVSVDEANLEQQLEKLLLHRVKQEIKKSASEMREDTEELDLDAQQVVTGYNSVEYAYL